MNRNKLLAKLHILLKQTGAEDQKEAIYAAYNVTSSRDMTDAQLLDLIGRLNGSAHYQAHNPHMGVCESALRALRSEVLFVLTANPDAQQPRRRGLGIPNDWQVLNPFILHHAGKRLPVMTYDELVVFKKQLYAMRSTGWRYRINRPDQSAPENPAPDTHPWTRGMTKERPLFICLPPDDGSVN